MMPNIITIYSSSLTSSIEISIMIKNPYPTRAEANDIYNSLEMGASALVLAGETAMGKYSIESVKFLSKIIKVFKNNKKLYD